MSDRNPDIRLKGIAVWSPAWSNAPGSQSELAILGIEGLVLALIPVDEEAGRRWQGLCVEVLLREVPVND